MHILVAGRQGQVARALFERASAAGLQLTALGRSELDITDRASVERKIASFSPDIIVNAAAYTAVDKAEMEEEAAFSVNAQGAGNVAAAATALAVPLIHLSTDYVFSGNGERPWREDDQPDPQGAYGRSKLAGEEAVRALTSSHAILRTSWVYAPFGHNFVRTMLRLAEERDSIRVVADQHGAPTYALDIADGIFTVAKIAHAQPQEECWRGLFHLTAAGVTTWAGFAEAIFSASAKRSGPSALVEPVSSADYPTAARRPGNSRLDNSRFRTTFAHTLPDWRDGVDRCVADLVPTKRKHD